MRKINYKEKLNVGLKTISWKRQLFVNIVAVGNWWADFLWWILFFYLSSLFWGFCALSWSKIAQCSFKMCFSVHQLRAAWHVYVHRDTWNSVCCEVLGWCQWPLRGEKIICHSLGSRSFFYSTEADGLLMLSVSLSQCFTPIFLFSSLLCVSW